MSVPVNEEIGANVEEETGGSRQLNQHNHQNDIVDERKPVPFGVLELEVRRLDEFLAVLVGVRRAATKADERLAILVVDVTASLTLTGGSYGSGGIVDALALVNRLGVAIVAAHLLDNGRRSGLLQHKTRVATHVVVDVAGGDASAQACIGQLVIKEVLTVLGGHERGEN